MNRGAITKILDWFTHPTYSQEGTPGTWLLGLVFILCLSFLWSRVVKQVVGAAQEAV